jgi:hypothetical protein
MLCEREIKIREMQEQISELTGVPNIRNNNYQSIMMTLNENAHMINQIATRKSRKMSEPTAVQKEEPSPKRITIQVNEKPQPAISDKIKELREENERLSASNLDLTELHTSDAQKIVDLQKLLRIKDRYLEIKMLAEKDTGQPDKLLGKDLANQASK